MTAEDTEPLTVEILEDYYKAAPQLGTVGTR